MCGRASDAIDPTGYGPYEFSHIRIPWRKLYNISPGQEIRIARRVDGAPDHRYVRWGLVPFFAKAEPDALPAENGHKTPHYVFMPDHQPFALAGLWDRWTSNDGAHELVSCTVLTRASGEFMRALHSREPVVVPEDRCGAEGPECVEPAA